MVSSTVSPPATIVGGSAGCDRPLADPGDYEGVHVFGDVEQPFWMVVPEVYADVAPAPLYLNLASGSGDHHGFFEGWRPNLDDLEGLMAIVNTSAGASPPGRRSHETLIALIDHIGEEYCVDPTRVHVMGTAWASGLADRLACEAPGRVASFVGAFGGGGSSMCNPERPVPLLTFTGDADRSGVTALVARWVEANGCDPEPLVDDLGSGVFRKSYENCEADLVYFDIEGLGHALPMHESKGPGARWTVEYEEVDFLEETLRFFADHPLP